MKVNFPVFTGTVLAALLFFCQSALGDAATITRTLEQNTRITPSGVIVAQRADIPMFKKGTVVTLNEFGEVLEGTLAEDIDLPYETGIAMNTVKPSYTPPPTVFVPYTVEAPPKYRVLHFKGDTRVLFNAKGEVINGTLSGPDKISLNENNRLSVTSGEIIFHKNGLPATCTLGADTYLRIVGWQQVLTDNFTDTIACPGYVEFKGGKLVKLNENGEVTMGTLSKETKLLANKPFSPPGVVIKKAFQAGTTVELDGKGIVVKAAE